MAWYLSISSNDFANQFIMHSFFDNIFIHYITWLTKSVGTVFEFIYS